jgi:hypothetical protein
MRGKTDLGSVAHLNAVRTHHDRNNAAPVPSRITIINEMIDSEKKRKKRNKLLLRVVYCEGKGWGEPFRPRR